MAFDMKYPITARYLTKPSKRRSGLVMSPGVRFIVAHDTGNPNSTAAGNVRYYENSYNDQSASAHIFVDDHEIIECIPALIAPPEKAWHVLYNVPTDNQLYGYNTNDATIGVEYCFGDKINADEAYKRYLWVIAYTCNKYGLDPARAIVGRFFLDPHRKTDPVTGLAHSRRTYEQLLHDIVTEYQECMGATPIAPPVVATTSGKVIATTRLNLRKGTPSTRAPIAKTVPPGTELGFTGQVRNGEPVNGNSVWYTDEENNYFWSGGVREI